MSTASSGLVTRRSEGADGVVQGAARRSDHPAMYTYRASVRLQTAHMDRAVMALRREIERLSSAERGLELPDWSTMTVEGPVEAYGPRGEVVFEYRGVVRGRNLAERRAGRR